jgi:hypothetical protein
MNELNGMTRMTMDDEEGEVKAFAPYSRADVVLFCSTMSKMFDDKSIVHYLANIIVNGPMCECGTLVRDKDGTGVYHSDGLVTQVNERGYMKPEVKKGSSIIWFDRRIVYWSVLTGSEELPYKSNSALAFFDIFNFQPLKNKLKSGAVNLSYDYGAKIEEYKKSNPELYEYYKPLVGSCFLVTKFLETRKGSGIFGFAQKKEVFERSFSQLLNDIIKESKNIISKECGPNDVSIGISIDDNDNDILKDVEEFVGRRGDHEDYERPTRTELTLHLL